MALRASASKSIGSCVFGAFARAVPLAFAASLAFPTCFALVDLAHGMAPRSRPPPGTSEYLYDIVCGVVAGGAVAASAFPSLAFLVSTRDPRESSSRTSAKRRFGFAKAFAVTIAAIAASRVAYPYAAIDAPWFTEDFPQQLSAFAAVTSGNVSDAALVFLPAGPGSVERAFKQTLESLESLGSFGSFTSPAEKTRNTTTESSTKYACDGSADYGVLRRWDLASYSLSGSGACATLSASLSRELAEAAASGKEIVTEIRVRAGAPRAAAGNATVVPITVDTRGATRWVIAVDARCAKRVAFAQGQDAEREDAEAEAKALGVRFSNLSIEPLYEAFMTALADEFSGLPANITEENLQARCRGVLLMSISNKKNLLVLTTGNKSELAVGYSTLYGDMAGGFDVLKDCPKMLVYALARYRNTLGECIPERVITRPPSAELAPDQRDEDSLPPYDILDQIIELYVEEDSSRQDMVDAGFSQEDVDRVVRLVDLNEYKRRQAPVGVRISRRAFGRDRRYPITWAWRSTS